MITKQILKQIAPSSNDKIITDLATYLSEYLQKYNINTYLRVCHFLAQAAHETAGFKTLEEYASGAAYEGRKDLGNIYPGDGKKFKGRGIFQLTGRSNYVNYGAKIGYNLESTPALASDPKISMLTACEYWNSKSLSSYADKDDISTITKRINGGFNGFEDRKNYLAKAKKIIPQDIFAKPINTEQGQLNFVIAKKGDKSPYVADLQSMLINKGAKITADGDYGIGTETAVKEFQKQNGLEITGNIDTNTINKLMV